MSVSGAPIACLACLALVLEIPRARAHERTASPDAAAGSSLSLTVPSEEPAFPWPALKRQEPLEREDGIAIGAGFADLVLRYAEGTLAALPWAALLMFGEGGNPPPSYYRGAVLFTSGVFLTAPLLNAVVVQAIGNLGRYHRLFGPIVLASYVSNLAIDAVTVALMATGFIGSGVTFYFFASIAGSMTMAIVQNAARQPLPEGTVARPPPAAHGLAFAF